MTPKHLGRFSLLLAACALAAGCSHKSTLEPVPLSTDPVVFADGFGSQLTWQAFGGSDYTALTLDATQHHTGTTSIKLAVPASGSYAGGAITARRSQLRDLTGYNALRFWAKATRPVTLDVVGLGNDNTGTSKYTLQRAAVVLTADWAQYTIAIPNSSRLTAEGGMFFVSEGPKAGGAFDLWLDDIEFANLPSITNPRPSITTQVIDGIAGAVLNLEGTTRTVFTVGGIDQTVTHSAGYFDYTSSDPNVATSILGGVQVVGQGTATITAHLAGVAATGTITLNATAPPPGPAPVPTLPAASVISLFSDSYANLPVDTWSANWDVADSATVSLAGNLVKRYTRLQYAGVEFTSHLVDASAMTAMHLDVWVPEGTLFKVKLVDFGANAIYAGGDDSECELTFNASTTPAFSAGAWVPLEIPLADFTTLTARGHLAQLILSCDKKIAYVDNIYFHQ